MQFLQGLQSKIVWKYRTCHFTFAIENFYSANYLYVNFAKWHKLIIFVYYKLSIVWQLNIQP